MLSNVDTIEKIEFNAKLLLKEKQEKAKQVFTDRKGQAWLLDKQGYDVDYNASDFEDGKN